MEFVCSLKMKLVQSMPGAVIATWFASVCFAADDADIEALKQQIQALDQKIQILERERENDRDGATAQPEPALFTRIQLCF